MKLLFSAAARRELNEAALWLELQERGLGERFLEEVAEARRQIIANPDAWHPLGPLLRRCRLKRFRYGLIYRLKPGLIEVIAVAHDRQRPGYWRDRLR